MPDLVGVAIAQLGLWVAMLWHLTASHADPVTSLGAIGLCLGIAAVAAVGVRRGRAGWSHVLVDGLFMAAAVAAGVVLGGAAGHGSHGHPSALDMSGPALLAVAGVWALVHAYGHPARPLARARRVATAVPMLVMFAVMIVAH
ncbi:hypothetical protein [Microbacterium sp. NPDC058389]|uniref:hypothetical protein n=1 Tax=Microbacterium sp. NPDC058389 TaxID=3346475 RepID=UPI00364DF82D